MLSLFLSREVRCCASLAAAQAYFRGDGNSSDGNLRFWWDYERSCTYKFSTIGYEVVTELTRTAFTKFCLNICLIK